MTEARLPDTMPAAVYRRPGVVEIIDVPVPTPEANEVLVEVSHCGVCGTDLHLMLEGWGRPDSINGHEYSGTVVAVGADVDALGLLTIGALVVGTPEPGCGSCRTCRAGRPGLCAERPTPGTVDFQGAFARYVRVPASQVEIIPPGLTPRFAALAEPVAVALHAITRGSVGPDDRVLIFGAGPIGAMILAALRHCDQTNQNRIDVVEPQPIRADLAGRLGADQILAPDDLPTLSIAEPGVVVEHPYDVVFECSGKRSAMESGLMQLDKAGSLVLVGSGIDAPSFDPNRILLNELTVTGSFEYDVSGFADALALLATPGFPAEALAEPDDVSLHGLVDAMVDLVEGRRAGKVLIRPGSPAH